MPFANSRTGYLATRSTPDALETPANPETGAIPPANDTVYNLLEEAATQDGSDDINRQFL